MIVLFAAVASATCSTDPELVPPGTPIWQHSADRWRERVDEPPKTVDDNGRAAEAMRQVGRAWERYRFLIAAEVIQPDHPDVTQLLAHMDTRYGRVTLKGSPRFRPPLCVETLPFAREEVDAITWAMIVIENTGSFDGMLPIGSYTFGGSPVVVEAGGEVEVKVKGRGR